MTQQPEDSQPEQPSASPTQASPGEEMMTKPRATRAKSTKAKAVAPKVKAATAEKPVKATAKKAVAKKAVAKKTTAKTAEATAALSTGSDVITAPVKPRKARAKTVAKDGEEAIVKPRTTKPRAKKVKAIATDAPVVTDQVIDQVADTVTAQPMQDVVTPLLEVSESTTAKMNKGHNDSLALALLSVAMLVVVALGGLAVDLGASYTRGQHLQQAADNAAVRGAIFLPDQELAISQSMQSLNKSGFTESKGMRIGITPAAGEVSVKITDERAPAYFLRLFKDHTTITRSATVSSEVAIR